ncbi:MAG: hypothetical protein KatS3mg118_2082 [Paracoccaceae bacterium]|nr:MAG: hypothetical protein KatS3mg118_2082 [Paracoccaceae bacterium]
MIWRRPAATPSAGATCLIINTGWHKVYDDGDYFAYCPGLVPSAADWMIEKGVKVVGHDTQANDHPLATAIGPQRNGPLLPHLEAEYREWSGGRDWKDDFPEWEPVHRKLFSAENPRHRKCRRRNRRRHRKTLHLRFLPMEMGPRRRMRHPTRRNHRPKRKLQNRTGKELLKAAPPVRAAPGDGAGPSPAPVRPGPPGGSRR